MSAPKVEININTAVEGQKELTVYQKELIKLGRSSEEVDKQVETLAETMGDLAQAEAIKKKLAETSEALDSTTIALETASDALVKSREEFLLFNEGADPKQLKEMNKVISDQEKELKKLERAQEKARKKYSDTNDTLSKSSDNVKRLITDNEHYNESLASVVNGQATLNRELSKLKDVSEAYNKLGVKDLEKEIEELEQAYKTLKDSGKLSASELKDAHQKLTDEVEKYKKSLNGTDQAYKDMKKGSLQILPIAVALAKVTKSAIDYEEAMADVKKVITATDEEFKSLNDSLLEMSKTTPVSAKGLAEIAAAGAQLGVEVGNIKEFVTITADMATAFDMTAEQAGNAVASLSNIFGIAINDTEKLGDAINHLSNNSAAKANQVVDVLIKIGSSGKAIGLTTEQTAALGATMISFGKSSDIAGTSINAMLSRLQMLNTLGTEGKNALDKIGISATEMSQRIRDDAAGAVVYFLEKVDQLNDGDKANALTQIFGRGPQADVLLMASNVGKLKEQLDLVGSSSNYLGSMQKEATSRAETTANQITLLKNNVDALSISLGSKLLPVINKAVSGLTGAVDAISDFSKDNPGITKLILDFSILMSSSKLLGGALTLMGAKGTDAIRSISNEFKNATVSAAMANIGFRAMNATLITLSKAIGALTLLNVAIWAAGKAFSFLTEQMKANKAVTDAHANAMKIIADRADKLADAQLRAVMATDKFTDAQKESGLTTQQLIDEEDRLIETLKNLGVDYELITNGISTDNKKLINEFASLGNNAVVTSKAISQSFSSILEKTNTVEEFRALTAEFNALAENGKVAGAEMEAFKGKLLELEQATALGIITEEEFKKKKAELVELINQQASSLATVSSEIAKQIELINVQIQQDKQVTDSLIKKLEAQREYAKSMNDAVRVQQLTQQIEATRLAGMKREASAIKEKTAVLKQELSVLQQRQKAGENLTAQEQARIKALQATITEQENETEALLIASQTRAKSTQINKGNTASIKELTKATLGLAEANQRVAESTASTAKSAKKANKQITRLSTVGSTPALKGLADEAKMSKEAVDALQKSLYDLFWAQMKDGAGFMLTKAAVDHKNAVINDIADEINRAEELEKIIANTENATLSQIHSWKNMVNGFNYVNDESIEGIKKQLETVKNATLNVYADIDRKNADLFNQLSGMRWADESYRMRTTQQNELLRLEEELNKAREQGDDEVIRRLERQKSLTIQIHNQQRKDAKTTAISKREEKKTVDININGEDVSKLDPNDPKFIRKITDEVVKTIEADINKSTWSKAARIK